MNDQKQNYKITLAYDGTYYYGWQKNIDGPSIEKTLFDALTRLLQHPTPLQAASRTDRGVHAEGQVVNFFTQNKPLSLQLFLHSLNKILPEDITVTSLEKALPTFHPTLDATGKEYHYSLTNTYSQDPFHRHFSWHVPQQLSLEPMRIAATHFLGTHDFSSLTNTRFPKHENTVCTLETIDISEQTNHRLHIRVIGDHFLYKMVRNLVGTLIHVGQGKLDANTIPTILQKKDRTYAGITAPANGLRLIQVFYKKNTLCKIIP